MLLPGHSCCTLAEIRLSGEQSPEKQGVCCSTPHFQAAHGHAPTVRVERRLQRRMAGVRDGG